MFTRPIKILLNLNNNIILNWPDVITFISKLNNQYVSVSIYKADNMLLSMHISISLG